MRDLDFNLLLDEFRDKSLDLMKVATEDMLAILNAVVENLKDIALAGVADYAIAEDYADAAHQLNMINNGMDQIIKRGSDSVPQVIVDYSTNLTQAIEPFAVAVGVKPQVLPEIINMIHVHTQSNDWNLIRQITPQVRAEIMQVFHDHAARGEMHPDKMAIALDKIGLPYSPVMQYSPGQRAGWIAYKECERIYESLLNQVRKEANIKHCVNSLNPTVEKHEAQCIAASAAGLITVEEMEKKYGLPGKSRHFGCRCTLYYHKPQWYDGKANQRDLNMLLSQGYDIDESIKKWDLDGPRKMAVEERWRENLRWENEFMETIFGKK